MDKSNTKTVDFSSVKCLVAGCGLFGSVLARVIAEQERKLPVCVIDRFPHIGGTAYSFADEGTGIEVHQYGSHIFHTDNEKVWNFVKRFSDFFPYRHKVLLKNRSKSYFLPVNLKTINEIGSCDLSPAEAEKLFRSESGEGVALREKIFRTIFAGYSAKQWGKPLKEVSSDILKRIPLRFDYNIDYFSDPFQGIPEDGYGKMAERMLDLPNITVLLDTDFFRIRHLLKKDCRIFYSGRLDELFDFRFGKLDYRSLRFEFSTRNVRDFQGTSVVNYGEKKVPYTRIHEFKHFQTHKPSFQVPRTVICREYPAKFREGMIPFYPVNDPENMRKVSLYRELLEKEPFLVAGGRIGSYSYLNMDQVIAQALEVYEKLPL